MTEYEAMWNEARELSGQLAAALTKIKNNLNTLSDTLPYLGSAADHLKMSVEAVEKSRKHSEEALHQLKDSKPYEYLFSKPPAI
jgi:hypothetical protein